jgi:hypothetical protein
MSVIMGVASPYWMKSIEPAVTSTLQRVSGAMKAKTQNRTIQPIRPSDQNKQISETAAASSSAASPVQKVSAAGGQK